MMKTTLMTAFAPAKINLYLHVTGQRDDGYHYLDSLVAFADVGDRLWLEPASSFSFALEGPMAPLLRDEDQSHNLVVRAAHRLAELTGRSLNVKLTLEKNLPVASGIGGGSTDAAAALRLLARYWGFQEDDPLLYKVAASLGQDIPCCIAAKTCYFEGIGDVVSMGPVLPTCYIVLANPRKAVPTPAVFKALAEIRQKKICDDGGDGFALRAPFETTPQTSAELVSLLKKRDNSLAAPACALLPEIQDVLDCLTKFEACLMARMSGSGATCFGVFANREEAQAAAFVLSHEKQDWWVVAACLPFAADEGVAGV